MRIYFCKVKVTNQHYTVLIQFVLNILCVTYFMASQTAKAASCDMSQIIENDVSASSCVSSPWRLLTILKLEIHSNKFFYMHICSSHISMKILSHTFIISISHLQAQLLMTSLVTP